MVKNRFFNRLLFLTGPLLFTLMVFILIPKVVWAQSFVFNNWATVSPADDWTFMVGNFAGDSRPDVVGYHPSNGTLWVGTNTGSGFSFANWATVSPANNWTFMVGNFAGDSRPDVVGYHPSNGTLWVGTNTP